MISKICLFHKEKNKRKKISDLGLWNLDEEDEDDDDYEEMNYNYLRNINEMLTFELCLAFIDPNTVKF